KKSREESCGEGSGVEILENKPYEDGPGGSGQYTHKVYHIGKHIPSWFCAILPQAALRVEEESWNAYPYTRTRYTCPFVEKFSIDIETYYKPDTGNQADVFNLSSAEKRQRTIRISLTIRCVFHNQDPIDIVKDYIPPHEYLVEEDPKLYQSLKTRRGPLSEDWIEEISQNPGQTVVMCAYKLCKVEFRYWGMQSKIERFIHDVGKVANLLAPCKIRKLICLRKVMVRAHRQAWCWQDEWYGLTIEDIRQLELETQLALAKKMAQYSLSEDGGAETNGSSVSQEQDPAGENLGSAAEVEGTQGKLGDSLETRGELTKQWSTSSRSSNRSSKRGSLCFHDNLPPYFLQRAHLTTASQSGGCRALPGTLTTAPMMSSSMPMNSKQGDVNTLSGAFETVMRVHYPAALGRITIRMVPCPAVCVDAFSLVSNSQDHIPLAALPLLATSAPQYQDAVATVILRANQVYSDFIKSPEGASFSGQDTDLLSPGIIINSISPSPPSLEGSRHLSRSNIDIPHSSGPDDAKKQLPRKRSDSSTYELDTIKHHQAFLSSSLHSSVLHGEPGSRRSSNSTMLEGGSLGKFDFEVTDFFLFGSPLGLVLALRKTVSNPHLLMESGGATSHRYHESPASETSILVPVLNSQTSLVHTEADTLQSHLYADGLCPASTSPGVPHLRCSRRASEASIASQVSGLADSYTATNIATSRFTSKVLTLTAVLVNSLNADHLVSSLHSPHLQQTNVK
ncbi:hypothetical protein GOODEAATRI_014684, partial [Goodea atripinnis]